MKKLSLCLALLGLLGLGGSAFAVQNTIDAVPAATLLLPYFEVDLTGNGINTLFSINNASATAVLAHVTVWSDWSVPVLDFDVYLTGYDVQAISMFDILGNGNLPVTASVGQDPKDAISPQGPASQDINFASCVNTLPYQNPAISPAFKAHLQAALKGLKSPATGRCYGEPYGDNIVRGYVTVDTVTACNLFFASDWAFYSVFITSQNVLWGDYFYVNATENFAQGDNLVHIEAFPQGFVTGDHTFYGRYNTATAADFREALPTTLAARYLNGGVFTGGTSLITWREGSNAAASVTCGTARPSWYPLEFTQVVFFDEEEQVVENPPCPSGDPTCDSEIAGIEAERWDVSLFALPFDFGWAYFNMQHSEVLPIYGDIYAQAWMTTVMDASGRFSVGFAGIQLDNANTPNTAIIPVP